MLRNRSLTPADRRYRLSFTIPFIGSMLTVAIAHDNEPPRPAGSVGCLSAQSTMSLYEDLPAEVKLCIFEQEYSCSRLPIKIVPGVQARYVVEFFPNVDAFNSLDRTTALLAFHRNNFVLLTVNGKHALHPRTQIPIADDDQENIVFWSTTYPDAILASIHIVVKEEASDVPQAIDAPCLVSMAMLKTYIARLAARQVSETAPHVARHCSQFSGATIRYKTAIDVRRLTHGRREVAQRLLIDCFRPLKAPGNTFFMNSDIAGFSPRELEFDQASQIQRPLSDWLSDVLSSHEAWACRDARILDLRGSAAGDESGELLAPFGCIAEASWLLLRHCHDAVWHLLGTPLKQRLLRDAAMVTHNAMALVIGARQVRSDWESAGWPSTLKGACGTASCVCALERFLGPAFPSIPSEQWHPFTQDFRAAVQPTVWRSLSHMAILLHHLPERFEPLNDVSSLRQCIQALESIRAAGLETGLPCDDWLQADLEAIKAIEAEVKLWVRDNGADALAQFVPTASGDDDDPDSAGSAIWYRIKSFSSLRIAELENDKLFLKELSAEGVDVLWESDFLTSDRCCPSVDE
ncbi:hypothetical protein M409DRAFT_61780 [Zasmidium cellare ATCC 36951]|uniref:Uncharacterized protein n=1 Tax=Zasmidium cellare ATCC 36951 TaxID=1080233 RepID=A0A6A6BU54_ZASCE|nr:uncharacterized protein M409DRAFT_61780 [Zasmidium cellare ATCC 36951]KAF2158301.1 hypothetical protein M409DRAFT_61780 [Zasmidium cellare ATCC 36951]